MSRFRVRINKPKSLYLNYYIFDMVGGVENPFVGTKMVQIWSWDPRILTTNQKED